MDAFNPLCFIQVEFAGTNSAWPKPIDKRACVPTKCEFCFFMPVISYTKYFITELLNNFSHHFSPLKLDVHTVSACF